jgi:hypothetical protein
MLSPNNYLSGFNPQTAYCGATTYSPLPDGSGPLGDNGLLVWKRATTDSSWTYQQVESHTGRIDNQTFIDDRLFIDKPSIAVSQHPNTAGAVYATYLRNPVNGTTLTQSIGFAMLDNVTPPAGQWKIRTNVPTPTPGSLQSPIVVVNQTSSESLGTVYVIYVDFARNWIYVYRTSDQGASWSADTTPPYFDLQTTNVRLSGYLDHRICTNRPNGDCIIAASIISARYNWHNAPDTNSGSIGFVLNAWDGSDLTVAKMRSYFFRWNPWPPCGISCRGFDKGPVALTDSTLDSWNPAIDFDSTGNYVVSWYRRNDNSTLLYNTSFAYIMNDGTFHHVITCSSCRTSDITRYPKLGGVQPLGYSIGDYQDIWYTSYLGFASAATVDIATSYGDIAAYNVVP